MGDRAHLQLVPYPNWTDELPANLRRLLQTISHQISTRALVPVLRAPTLKQAEARAQEGVVIFYELWTAYVVTLASWLKEEPSREQRLMSQVRRSDLFTSEVAVERLGPTACEHFAAAADSRTALVRALDKTTSFESLSSDEQERVELLSTMANHEIALGTVLVNAKKPLKVARGFAEHFAKRAFAHARDAYVILSASRYAETSRTSAD